MKTKDLKTLLVISSYTFPTADPFSQITIQRIARPDGPDRWAIKHHGNCLNKNGEWEHEPIPSNRDEDFLARCRYDSFDEACECLAKIL